MEVSVGRPHTAVCQGDDPALGRHPQRRVVRDAEALPLRFAEVPAPGPEAEAQFVPLLLAEISGKRLKILLLIHPDGAELDAALAPEFSDLVVVLPGGVDQDVVMPSSLGVPAPD